MGKSSGSSGIQQACIAITGAASGLGAAFLQHYSGIDSDEIIIAIDTSSIDVSNSSSSDKVRSYQVDVLDEQAITKLRDGIKDIPIRLLTHCAGVRGLVPSHFKEKPGDVAAAETLDVMNTATMMATFEINCVGTMNIIQSFLPGLQQYSAQTDSRQAQCVVLGSRMGSIAANVVGGGYAYRASKAALNAVIRSLSIDIKDVDFTVLHPGRVETGLVGRKEDGAINPEESVEECVKLIDRLPFKPSRLFVDRFGDEILW